MDRQKFNINIVRHYADARQKLHMVTNDCIALYDLLC